MNHLQKLIIASACLIAIALRLHSPGLPNFGAMVALSLLCGSVCRSHWALLIPIAVRAVTDIVLEYKTGYGFYSSWVFDYSGYLLIGLLGMTVNRKSAFQVGGGTLASIVLFYLVSNFGVWYCGNGQTYSDTAAGLVLCMQLGLEFVTGTIIGNLVFAPLFFGAFAYAESKYPATAPPVDLKLR